MNIICSLRTRLSVNHLSSLMLISLTGPPLDQWDPLPYVKKWLAANRRDATCTNCPSKQTKQSDKKEFQSLWNVLNRQA
jgi:hypothetical protein